MFGLGVPELVIILVIVLVLFGSTRLPKLARSLGQASKEFKDGLSVDDKEAAKDAPAAAPKEESVTMSKADLDALLAEREAKAAAQARADAAAQAPPPPPPPLPPTLPTPPSEGTPSV